MDRNGLVMKEEGKGQNRKCQRVLVPKLEGNEENGGKGALDDGDHHWARLRESKKIILSFFIFQDFIML